MKSNQVKTSETLSDLNDQIKNIKEQKLFVGGLNEKTTKQTLYEYFSKYGEITYCTILENKSSKSRGFGFVIFKNDDEMQNALKQKFHEIDGKQAEIKIATPKENTEASSAASMNSIFSSKYQSKKVFIGGLAASVTEKDLIDYFIKFGDIQEVIVMREKYSKKSRGFGFILFKYEESIKLAVESSWLKPHVLHGKPFECKVAMTKEICDEKKKDIFIPYYPNTQNYPNCMNSNKSVYNNNFYAFNSSYLNNCTSMSNSINSNIFMNNNSCFRNEMNCVLKHNLLMQSQPQNLYYSFPFSDYSNIQNYYNESYQNLNLIQNNFKNKNFDKQISSDGTFSKEDKTKCDENEDDSNYFYINQSCNINNSYEKFPKPSSNKSQSSYDSDKFSLDLVEELKNLDIIEN